MESKKEEAEEGRRRLRGGRGGRGGRARIEMTADRSHITPRRRSDRCLPGHQLDNRR